MNESPVPESVNDVYPKLFSPMQMAGRELKSRIVHASITTSFPRDDRHISEKHFRYFVNRARGGAAMAITEPLGIAPHQPAIRVRVWDAHLEDELKRWAAAVEGEGCRFLGQIMDSGRGRHVPGRNPAAIGAAAQPDDLSWTVPHVLTADEIKRFVDHAAASALRLCRCGFSGVEISSGHGQLFHQFLSPWSNTREDGYGGDLEGRARLLVEVCTAIRQSCGDGFILGVKLPGNDGVPGGVNPAMAADIARHLVGRVKVDYLCYAQGSHHRSLEMHIPDDSTPRLTYMGMIAELRKATPGVPVMALGRITDPAEAEGILVRGDSDLVALGRSLIVDPMWPNKAQAGRARDIRYCVSCNTCWRTAVNSVIVCDNNPRLATPEEVAIETPRVAVPRRIVIVGAGIAGLEAACAAAERGHSVTVLGSSPEAGGKARLQASLPSSESLSSVYDYQWITANKAGVRFALGETATVDSVLAHRPDAVVLATGATMIWPRCLPPELKNDGLVRDLRESIPGVLALKACQPGAAVIYDMDHMEGTYAAVELLHRFFDEVVILTPRERIAEDVPLVTRQRILRRFGEMGIRVHVLVEPLWTDSFENEGRLDFKSIYRNTVQSVDNVAFFSYSTPRAPNDALLNPLRKAGLEVHLIGDCKAARAVQDATAEGYAIGRAL